MPTDHSGAGGGPSRSRFGLAGLGQDGRNAVRQIIRRPGFALLAAGTLALGIAASTAVFAYVNAYSRPFPGADAQSLYQVYLASEQNPFGPLSYPDFEDLSNALDGVAGMGLGSFGASVRFDDHTDVAFGEAVTGSFFPLLHVEMAVGRGLTREDDRPGAPPVVVLSHDYWAATYASDTKAVGGTILLNNEPYTIVGVTAPSFRGGSADRRPAFWLPYEQYMRVYWARSDRRVNRQAAGIYPVLRLDLPGAPARARQALATLAHALDGEAPLTDGPRTYALAPATWISPATRAAESSTTLIMLMAAASLLLLACANVANLSLSSGARRYREMALRSAVGASRRRLVRQLLVESLLLSSLAGVVALVSAGPLSHRLSSYFARPSVWGTNVPREITVDPRVLAFAVVVAVLTGLVTGLVPALRASGRNPASALGSGGTWSSTGRGGRGRIPGTRDLLVAGQIALTVVLLFVAGLVLRTLEAAQDVDAGFDVEHTLASYVSTSSMGIPVDRRHRFFEELQARFRELPWVDGATVAENAPLSAHPREDLRVENGGEPVTVTVARVWPGYFETLGMEILRGRSFERSDSADAPGVVVVNQALARRVADDGDAVGHVLWWPAQGQAPERGYEVVGVVRNAHQTTFPDDPEPVAYFALTQHYSAPGNAFVLKVKGDPAAAVDLMRQELRRVDTRIAIVNILPYTRVVSGFLYTQEMNAEMFGVIAGLGLILACAGLFGVVALAVARRRREIAIRVAVGADRASVAHFVLSTVAGPVGVGLVLGLAGAWVARRLVANLLWGVTLTDPVAIVSGGVVLAGAVGLAVVVPLRRALRADPVTALRAE